MSTGKNFISRTAQTAPPETTRPDERSLLGRRRAVSVVRGAGMAFSVAGGVLVAVGAVLPWAHFSVFGVELAQPGVMGLGAISLAAAVLALLHGRRFPLLAVALGLLVVGIGAHAQKQTGRAVKGRLLALHQALAPVNDRLMRVGLPTIEPFDRGRTWADFLGPGPLWTLWGGAALAAGGAAQFAGARLLRSCRRCGAHWPTARAAVVAFCPACGLRVGPLVACPACHARVEPGDTFCAACGVSLSSPSSPADS